jgi:hypothetical protein
MLALGAHRSDIFSGFPLNKVLLVRFECMKQADALKELRGSRILQQRLGRKFGKPALRCSLAEPVSP